MTIHDLDTPALLIDLHRLEANLRRASNYCRDHGLRLRPHTKTHKTPEIGRMQLDCGAAGLTVAKVGEAEVMAASGTADLLVAYPIWGEAKVERLMQVARRCPVTVALDSEEVAEGLSRGASRAGREIAVLAEADVGMKRCGRAPGEALLRLARRIEQLPGLRLEGVMYYPGHIWPPSCDLDAEMRRLSETTARIQGDFQRAGLPLNVMSGGSTPTLRRSHEVEGLTEVRPGTYVFCDADQVAAGACGWGDCAASVLTTVISTPRGGFAFLDGGSKTFTSDTVPGADRPSFGRVLEAPDAVLYQLNEEHGYLDLSASEARPRIGDRLRVIPNHVCVCVNMHEKIYGVRGEQVEHVWTVAGRGKLQ